MASAVANAKRANAVVKKRLSVGPGNRWYSGMGAVFCVKAQRRASMKELDRRAAVRRVRHLHGFDILTVSRSGDRVLLGQRGQRGRFERRPARALKPLVAFRHLPSLP